MVYRYSCVGGVNFSSVLPNIFIMKPVIVLKDICFQYPNSKKGLIDISVQIPKGKKVAVLGLNGAGKSTFFLTLCGVEKYLAFLNIVHLKNNAPHELSYGQKKMVAIAGVLAMNPQVLIFDEPFAWLDVRQEESMKDILEKLHQQGKTILISTHNLDFVHSWADCAVVLKEGQCVFSGAIAELERERLELRL